jgi:hypothetical protein
MGQKAFVWNARVCRSRAAIGSRSNVERLSQSVSSAAITDPHPTIPAKEYVAGQVLVADFALQTSVIPPSPLRISMVVTSDVFILSKLLQYAIERDLTAKAVKW